MSSLSRRSLLTGALWAQQESFPDLSTIAPDLTVPETVQGDPAPGKRVRQTLAEYAGTNVHHTLYLPVGWKHGWRYPVIVEYAGNGNFRNQYGDVSTGVVEGSKLGYGISGGRRFIWICAPYVNRAERTNQITWWGDVEATVQYAIGTVRMTCERYGGDPSAVIVSGFSRGAIACNYIGLHNDEIADVWLAFIAYSHYDGAITTWPYEGADRASALARLQRLKGRAVFICQERSVENTRVYIESSGIRAPFTFQPIGFRNHNDGWALRDIPERRAVRRWLDNVLRSKPGTHRISGVVRDGRGRGIGGLRVESGATHWTTSGRSGRFEIGGLIDSRRMVEAGGARREIALAGADVGGLELTVSQP